MVLPRLALLACVVLSGCASQGTRSQGTGSQGTGSQGTGSQGTGPAPASPTDSPPSASSMLSSSASPSAPALPPIVGNPFVGRELFVNPHSGAAKAAADPTHPEATVLARLAEVPTAMWLTPEAHPPGNIGSHVASLTAEAHATQQLPVFVVYGIPARDCAAHHSAGGLSSDQYVAWVAEIAAAVGTQAVVVLEPDALPSALECGIQRERRRLLSGAVDALAGGPVTYVDAGHSGWLEPAAIAEELRRVGVDQVRGFSVNVSAYGFEDDERAYADELAGMLGDASYVIDTGRAGAGSDGTWCNPPGRALGAPPAGVDDGTAMDARLWIKPPGESDGTCHGGPEAGQFWTQRAIELAHAAGW